MRHVYIVPTFSCQFECQSCYGKKFLGRFPGYLSWESFLNVYSILGSDTDSFVFAGGEPSVWKFLQEAIIFLRNKSKTVSVLSNGIRYIEVPPNFLMLNGSTLLNPVTRADVADNVERYIQKSIGVTIRFNIDKEWSADDTRIAVTYGKMFSASVSLSLRYPVARNNLLGTSIYKLAQALCGADLRVRMSRCAPPCIFTGAQRDYLFAHCGMRGKCPLPSGSVVVLPDGESIQPCVELESPYILKDLESKTPRDLFGDYVSSVKASGEPVCVNCDYFNKACSGGCLAYLENRRKTGLRDLSHHRA